MSEVRIFFNPECSTCRNAMEILREKGVDPEVVEYLTDPPTEEEIREVLRLLGAGARAILREKEREAMREAGIGPDSTDDEVIAAMAKHPILIQRPIVVANGRAVVGRPAEKVMDVL